MIRFPIQRLLSSFHTFCLSLCLLLLFQHQSKGMASTQGQDVVLCQLCTNPVEHHCNLCHVNLSALPALLRTWRIKHIGTKLWFINRKEGHVLPSATHTRKPDVKCTAENAVNQLVHCVLQQHTKTRFY